MDSVWTVNLILNVFLPPFLVEPHCRQRGINFAVLQNSKVCGLHSVSVGAGHAPHAHSTPRGSRQMCMQACTPVSLLMGINILHLYIRSFAYQLDDLLFLYLFHMIAISIITM